MSADVMADLIAEPVPDETKVPPGWAVLPAGPTRRIRVNPDALYGTDAKPFYVFDENGKAVGRYAAVEANGPVRLVYVPDASNWKCGKAHLEAACSLLVCVEPAAAVAKAG